MREPLEVNPKAIENKGTYTIFYVQNINLHFRSMKSLKTSTICIILKNCYVDLFKPLGC